ncbi:MULTISPECIES: hypothetical protein [Pseudonocardiaceae]|uniref:hypothetical protein n=1 Tax=Pseudonocardiaceae TaxID=2070 RepID=UPI00059F04D5|nr:MULTISPECIES: hypothetical protein [Pseudonocardiaceae]
MTGGIVLDRPFESMACGFDLLRSLRKRECAASCRVAAVVAVVDARSAWLGGQRLFAGFGLHQVSCEAGDHTRELVHVGWIAADAAHHHIAHGSARANASSGLPVRRTDGAFLLLVGRSRNVGAVVVGLVRGARLSAHERPLRAHEVRGWRGFMGLLVGDRNRRHSGHSQPPTPAVAGPREAGFAATRARTMTCVE